MSEINQLSWKRFVREAKLPAMTRQFVEQCLFCSYDGVEVVLAIKPELAHMANDKNWDTLHDALVEYFEDLVLVRLRKDERVIH